MTDSGDRKQYFVVGRVLNSFHKPVSGCQIYLSKGTPPLQKDVPLSEQHIPVAVTDAGGDYSFVFELGQATVFYLYFDAREQGYQARWIDITNMFTSHIWQYTGTNPVVVNAVLIPEDIAIESDFEQ